MLLLPAAPVAPDAPTLLPPASGLLFTIAAPAAPDAPPRNCCLMFLLLLLLLQLLLLLLFQLTSKICDMNGLMCKNGMIICDAACVYAPLVKYRLTCTS